jgi:hypothetical protein
MDRSELITRINHERSRLDTARPEPWGRGSAFWELIGGSTFWHDPDHTESIETCLRDRVN